MLSKIVPVRSITKFPLRMYLKALVRNHRLDYLSNVVYDSTGYNPPTPPPPKPPATTNVHRYFIYVFEQQHDLDEGEVDSRCGFDIDDYQEKYGLTPVAMNMFKTQKQSM